MYNHVKPCVLLLLRLMLNPRATRDNLLNYPRVVDLVVVCMYVCL